jgi:phage terminase large subunit-like protein
VKLIPFDTTLSSKPGLIQNLYWMLHEGNLRLQDDPVKRHQLRNFVSKQTASGHWSYEAASGHDDYVMALALAAWGTHNPQTLTVAPAPAFIAQHRG